MNADKNVVADIRVNYTIHEKKKKPREIFLTWLCHESEQERKKCSQEFVKLPLFILRKTKGMSFRDIHKILYKKNHKKNNLNNITIIILIKKIK